MKFKSLLLLGLFGCLVLQAKAQTRVIRIDTSEQQAYVDWEPSVPKSLFSPYLDLLVGLSTFEYRGSLTVGPLFAMRGGVNFYESLLVGTGISAISLANYDLGLVVPIEFGYRLPNQKWDLRSGIGYVYIPWKGSNYLPKDRRGRTFSFDGYWRPSVTKKDFRLVVGAGALMYDMGDSDVFSRNCSSCEIGKGPKLAFSLKVGVGF